MERPAGSKYNYFVQMEGKTQDEMRNEERLNPKEILINKAKARKDFLLVKVMTIEAGAGNVYGSAAITKVN